MRQSEVDEMDVTRTINLRAKKCIEMSS